ncbi:uncharacterized protein BDV14DRAFT_20225 [Aspergillus stella-maris]|uniref:uncharacterized protein n=1 Tax=Aspergillus stella-maris TaxID=1810926 RepID=UPI003CCDF75E
MRRSIKDILCNCIYYAGYSLYPAFIVLAWVCWAVDEVFQYVRPRNISKRRHERPTRAPVALPRRRRALSIPLPTPRSYKEVRGQRTFSQRNSLFFRLPTELRDIMYRDFLEFPVHFHVWRTHKRLCSISCTHGYCFVDQKPACGTFVSCRPPLAQDGSGQRVSVGRKARERFLPLLTSCRRIYSEIIYLLYTKNNLIFDDNHTIQLFPTVVPSHRLSAIRYLYIRFYAFKHEQIDTTSEAIWKQLCIMLKELKHLDTLTILLTCHTRDININHAGYKLPIVPFLNPLTKVKAKTFRVWIPPGCDLTEAIGGDEQTFSIHVENRQRRAICPCCVAKRRRYSALPFPPSWG